MMQTWIDEVARSYQRASHVPQHPSYGAFARETLAQYREMLSHGIQVIPIPGTLTGSSHDMFRLLDLDKRLYVATDGAPLEPNHPLAARVAPGITLNTAFRAVHDYFGHYAARTPFETFDGEIRAYQTHVRKYGRAAQAALFSETAAQLCVYYATGDFVKEQKCAIL